MSSYGKDTDAFYLKKFFDQEVGLWWAQTANSQRVLMVYSFPIIIIVIRCRNNLKLQEESRKNFCFLVFIKKKK